MNRICLVCWLYGSDETCFEGARDFYNKLHKGVEQGKEFPFDCPYQVYLLRNRLASESVVAVLVMRGTPGDDSIEQNRKLKQWFKDCDASGWHDLVGKPMRSTTIQSTLELSGLSYEFVESFGTIE